MFELAVYTGGYLRMGVIEGTSYKRTDKFEYIGTVLNKSDMAMDIKPRLLKGNKCT
jgi:hypothetical protein